MYYSAELLIQRMKQMPDFKGVPYHYHIIGVRNHMDEPNKFDDVFNLMYGEKLILTTSGTTNPGTPVLNGGFLKYNKDGAAVVEADRIYYGVWKYRLHNKRIPALCQWWPNKTEPITIYRDGDMDDKSEEIGKRTTGYYGINFHPDQYDINAVDKSGENINGWSAGCQVCNVVDDYREIINLTRNQGTVTYTLLNEFSV